MVLKVNGNEYITEQDTVLELLQEMKISGVRVAVEVNLQVVRRADFESCRLNNGDCVEIVNMVGGG